MDLLRLEKTKKISCHKMFTVLNSLYLIDAHPMSYETKVTLENHIKIILE